MKTKWIVVANRTQARIFKQHPFMLVKKLENELGRLKNKSLTTDKPGSGTAKFSGSTTTHTLTGEKDPHEDAAIQFARTIGHYLEHEAVEHRYEAVTIIAEPKMLGRIRKSLTKNVPEPEWVSKDYGHLSDLEVQKALG